jgi:hypothetical protein
VQEDYIRRYGHVPNADKILEQMQKNAAAKATLLKHHTDEWNAAVASFKANGVDNAEPGVSERMVAALTRGELWVWKVENGGYHVTDIGFSPGNQSVS